ncbi:hypothetical protein [Actinomadura violacea]|uniref:DUF4179 domain-containing protein n=1 Tax=Actinomadura violacea TaxID=2819934 RepID=A0ABS3S7K6_9ACTN|nr:hypothetical protein [Actinomadura violacea]MBO2464558.1 hypothetical protein [Actinomadura violacea]
MNDLKERLERIAAAPGPATSVDPAAAIRKGRRIRRGRRAAAGTALAGLAAAVAAVAVLPGSPEDPHRTVRPAERAGYPALLVPPAAFGWLPKGYAQTEVTRSEEDGTSYTLAAGKGDRPALELTVLESRTEPPIANLSGGKKGGWTKTALINGRIGHWTIEPGGPGSDQVPAELRWEYQPHHWALLSVTDRAIAQEPTVLRIAKGVAFGSRGPAPFPFRARGVPSGLKPVQVSVGTGPRASVRLTSSGSPGGDLGIEVAPARRTRAPVNTKIDGHPAFDSRLPHGGPKVDRDPSQAQRLVVYNVRGFDVTVQATGGPLRRLQASGGLTGLYRRVTLLGDEPVRWTAPLG